VIEGEDECSIIGKLEQREEKHMDNADADKERIYRIEKQHIKGIE